jgi:serine protease Do
MTSRAKFGGALGIAFVSGLVFASGFDLTRFGYAQQAKTVARTASSVPAAPTLVDLNNSFTSIAEHVTPAVVSIQSERTEPQTAQQRTPRGRTTPPSIEDFFDQFDPRRQQQPLQASGSGFIVSKDGYILTNNHVVADFDRVTVTLTDHRRFSAKVIGRDPTTDVAVIKIDGHDLPVATLGNDESVRIGEWVLAIGNPLGFDFTVTAGIVSAKGRGSTDLPNLNNDPYAVSDFIQTDAAINPGNSGGPLFNIEGKVIGINSAIASQTGYYSGYGFAIPITLAKNVMDDIIAHGRVRRAALGVRIQNVLPEDAAVAGLKDITGVKVAGLNGDDSPGAKAGLEAGDIIIRADGKPVDRVSTLQRIIRAHEPGDVVAVDVMRFGQQKSFRVKLTEVQQEATTVARAIDDVSSRAPGTVTEKLGVTVETVTAEQAQANQIPADKRGLHVVEVSQNGPARTRLIPGTDILVAVLYPTKRPLKSPSDLQAVLSTLKNGDYISLLVYDSRPQVKDTRVVNLHIGSEF